MPVTGGWPPRTGSGAQLHRAQPQRLDRHLAQEPVEELGGPLQRDLDVLDDALTRRPTAALVERAMTLCLFSKATIFQ